MSHEITGLSAAALAAKIRGGELSARETAEAHIRRIEEVNPRLNAVVVPLFDEALAAARAADEAQARGAPLGPLHGVPLTVKECFHLAGTPSTIGLTKRRDRLDEADSPLVARLRAAGAILLGKTNVPQLMLLHESVNPVYGRTNNPWDAERTSGGSSGGEAAIIAAGGSAGGIGSDLGGSIRLPAHFCGVAGFKPSSRRLTREGTTSSLRGLEGLQWQPGPLARHVDDLELILHVLAGDAADSREPEVVPAPLRSARDVRIDQLRIGYWESNDFFPCAPAVRRAVREAVAGLAEQGATMVPLEPPKIAEAMFLFTALLSADGGAGAERMLRASKVDSLVAQLLLSGRFPRWLRPLIAWALEKGGAERKAGLVRTAMPRSADELWQLTWQMQQYRRDFLAYVADCDALVLPVYALPAPKHGKAMDLIVAASDTLLVNLIGLPSGVVPVTRVRAGEESDRPASRELADRAARQTEEGSAGLPIGVQVASHFWREDVALAVMQAIERHVRQQSDFPATPIG